MPRLMTAVRRGRPSPIGLLIAALMLAFAWVAPAMARTRVPHQEIEAWIGYTAVAPDALDDMVSFGFRGGYQVTPIVSLYGEFGVLLTDGGVGPIDFDYTSISLDYVADLSFMPERRYHPTVFGGPGFTFLSLDVEVDAPFGGEVGEIDDDSFTLLWGGGVKIDATDRILLRPAARWRWLEQRDEDSIDFEILFGVAAKLF